MSRRRTPRFGWLFFSAHGAGEGRKPVRRPILQTMIATDPQPAPPVLSGEARLVLLWMIVVFAIIFVPFLLFAIRKATIATAPGRRARKKSKPSVDAWSEAGRRLVADQGVARLDDTVDIDPFDAEDEPW